MRRALRDNGLTLFFLVIFVAALAGQAVAGHANNNEELAQHGQPPLDIWQFVTSSDFLVDVAENWQSEFFQFFLFILATVWFVQRGSPESKRTGDEGVDDDRGQLLGRFRRADSPRSARVHGRRRVLYENSLLALMGVIFVLSWFAQSLGGLVVANEEGAWHGLPEQTWGEYVVSPEFWNRTLQNWQSEFLAVGCMVAFSIYLRQRGSSESKPVGLPNDDSAVETE